MSLPKRRKPKRSGIRDGDGPIRCPAHLQWVRGHECAIAGALCEGPIEAAHVRMGLAGGMGMKPGDDRAVPLCAGHHRGQHTVGEAAFWRLHGIDPIRLAANLASRSPHWKKLRKDDDRSYSRLASCAGEVKRLKGPQAKNGRFWQHKGTCKGTQLVVIRERGSLTGPKAKNSKPWVN